MNKYFRAVLANYAFFLINTVFLLIITSIAVRVLGEEFYGLWTILNAIMLFSGVGTLGMGVVVNKFASEKGKDAIAADIIISSGIIIMLPMAGLGMTAIILLREWVASHINVSPDLQVQFRQALGFTALTIIPQFVARVPIGYLYSQLKNHLFRLVEISGNIALWVGVILIAMYTRNLVWMALWGLIVQLISLAILLGVLIKMKVLYWRFHLPSLRRMISFSYYSFLENIAMAMYQQLDRIVIGFVLGPAAAGVYAVGTSLGLRLPMIVSQATDVMLPYASRKDSLKEQPALYNVFRNLSRTTGILLALIGSLLILWMHEIVSLWISTEFAGRYDRIFSVIVFAYIPLSLSRPGHQTLAGMGQVRFTSFIQLVSSVVMLAGVYYFSINYGLMGAAAANLTLALLLVFNISVYQRLAGSIPWREILSDTGWALLLPAISLGIVIWNPVTKLRLLITFLALGISLILAFKSEFFRTQILQYIYHPIRDGIFKKVNNEISDDKPCK